MAFKAHYIQMICMTCMVQTIPNCIFWGTNCKAYLKAHKWINLTGACKHSILNMVCTTLKRLASMAHYYSYASPSWYVWHVWSKIFQNTFCEWQIVKPIEKPVNVLIWLVHANIECWMWQVFIKSSWWFLWKQHRGIKGNIRIK